MKGKLISISGAGLSAESGIPTFRDAAGLWESHRIDQVANFHTWKENRALVHRFYNDRRVAMEAAKPNPAHEAVARWESRGDTVILTQNIDPLLERAGAKNVVHLHGSITAMHCTACDTRWDIGFRTWDHERERCPKCRSIRGVKPGVIFFHEHAPEYRVLHRTLKEIRREDILIVIGTSGIVLPVAEFARAHQGISILNNLTEEKEIPRGVFKHAIYKPASEAAGLIEELIDQRRP